MDYLSIGITKPGVKKIKAIQFGVTSPIEIEKTSVCVINKSSLKKKEETGSFVYDDKMGVIENTESCGTCGSNNLNCTGHFGMIDLAETVIHPKFIRHVYEILKCVCRYCSRTIVAEDEAKVIGLLKFRGKDRFSRFIKIVEKYDKCSYCDALYTDYKLKDNVIRRVLDEGKKKNAKDVEMTPTEIYNIFLKIPNKDFELLGFNTYLEKNKKYSMLMIEEGVIHRHQIRPEWLLLQKLPVLPIIARPYAMRDGKQNDDDLTAKYIEITKTNNKLLNPKENKKRSIEAEIRKNKIELQEHIATLFDNKGGKSKISGSKAYKGIRERLDGKEGYVRQNLQGKRVDFTGRCVAGPSAWGKINEIFIPEEVAKTLTRPIFVNSLNQDFIQKMINQNYVNNIIRKGRKIILYDPKSNKISTLSEQYYELENGKLKVKFGDIAEVQLQDNDDILINRQPTLRPEGIMAGKTKIIRGNKREKIIRINLSITTCLNCDFDGRMLSNCHQQAGALELPNKL